MPTPLDNPVLAALYPFLVDTRQSADQLDLVLLESLRRKADESVAAKQRFFAESGAQMIATARAIAAVYRRGGRFRARCNAVLDAMRGHPAGRESAIIGEITAATCWQASSYPGSADARAFDYP